MSDLGILCTICLGKDHTAEGSSVLPHTASSCPMRSKFKNSNGQLLRRGIFLEEAVEPTNIIYTLRDEDHKGYPSLYRLYMEMMDVTEYEFATTYLHSWKHWQDVSNSPWFRPYIDRWRHELELKLKVRAIKEIMHEASSGGKNSFAANKWLVDKGWAPTEGRGRGRPSKNDIKQAAYNLAQDDKIVEDAFDRIMN